MSWTLECYEMGAVMMEWLSLFKALQRALTYCVLQCLYITSCCSVWRVEVSFCISLLLILCQAVGSDGIRVMMESALTARDRVGVQDFVLLENYTSEVAFIENLRKRFKENLIYVSAVLPVLFTLKAQSPGYWSDLFLPQTYIGSVLVSMNPYKDLEIYTKQHMERYRGVNFYEVSPHM